MAVIQQNYPLQANPAAAIQVPNAHIYCGHEITQIISLAAESIIQSISAIAKWVLDGLSNLFLRIFQLDKAFLEFSVPPKRIDIPKEMLMHLIAPYLISESDYVQTRTIFTLSKYFANWEDGYLKEHPVAVRAILCNVGGNINALPFSSRRELIGLNMHVDDLFKKTDKARETISEKYFREIEYYFPKKPGKSGKANKSAKSPLGIRTSIKDDYNRYDKHPINGIVRDTLSINLCKYGADITGLDFKDRAFISKIGENVLQLNLSIISKNKQGVLTKDRIREVVYHFSKLRTLNVSHPDIDDSCIKEITKLTNLVNLNLESSTITTNGLQLLAKRLVHLEEIDLTDCQYVTDIALACLTQNSTLKTLKIGPLAKNDCPISDQGLKYLSVNRSIKTLWLLAIEKITHEGFHALRFMPTLENLSIRACKNFTDIALEECAEIPNLQELEMKNCNSLTQTAPSLIAKKMSVDCLVEIRKDNKAKIYFIPESDQKSPHPTLQNVTFENCANIKAPVSWQEVKQ